MRRAILGWQVVWMLLLPALVVGQEAPLAELRSTLRQDEGNARRNAVVALGGYPTPEAVALLLATYRAEAEDAFGVRAACAGSLGDTGQSSAVVALSEILGDRDYWVRKQAATALGKLPGSEVLAALRRAAQDRDARVRAAAVRALGEVEGSGEVLLRAYGDAEPKVAAAALEALAVSRHPQAPARLEQALDGAPWLVRYRAAGLLARAGEPRGLAALAEGVRRGHHSGAALRELAGVGPPAVATLAALYREAEAPLAARVLDSLEGVEAGVATGFFADLAAAGDAPMADRVRAAAILFDRREALTAAQVEGVSALLEAGDVNLTAVALQILLERGGPGVLPRVAPLVHHDSKVVRHFALFNLRRHGEGRYESSFVEALADANGANVRLALEALEESGTARSLPAIRALADERKYRRYALAAADAIEARGR